MALFTTGSEGILSPEEVGALVVQPVEKASVATQISTVVNTGSHEFRIPVVTGDVTAVWTPEGSDITPSDPGTDALVITPKKLASLTILSNELADDSSPEATELVGNSIARDIAKKIDLAFFAATTPNGPSGIESIAANYQTVDTDQTPLTNTDAFAEAISLIENVGGTATSFIANANTVLALSRLKKLSSGSNEPLLQPDPTLPTRRQILGVPLYSVPAAVVPDGTVWAVDASKTFVVIRKDVDLAVDTSYAFGKDSLAVRATMRIAFGFPHAEAIVRIGAVAGS